MQSTENWEPFVRSLEATAKDKLANWPSEWVGFHWPGYTYEHTLRVRNLSRAMARTLGADDRLVEVAALLHDIGKPEGEPHGDIGAGRAEEILASLGVGAPDRRRVCDLVRTHLAPDPSYPTENLVLSDADYIDANFGYVAFARYITIRASRDMPVNETVESAGEWLANVDGRRRKVVTDLGRTIAEERFGRMATFLESLREDLRGGADGDGAALVIARYLAADAHRPSLLRQVAHMRQVLAGERREDGLRLSATLGSFAELTDQEMAGER